jgi:hypothetical protein
MEIKICFISLSQGKIHSYKRKLKTGVRFCDDEMLSSVICVKCEWSSKQCRLLGEVHTADLVLQKMYLVSCKKGHFHHNYAVPREIISISQKEGEGIFTSIETTKKKKSHL